MAVIPTSMARPSNAAIGGLVQAWGSIRTQVAQNRRLAYGLAAAVLLLWLYALLLLVDAAEAGHRRLAASHAQLASLQAAAQETQWSTRRNDAEALRDRLLARLWSGDSEGVAQADFQELLVRSARDSGLGRPNTRVERDPTQVAASGFRPIGATLSADFTPAALYDFLSKISAADRLLTVRGLRVQRQPLARIDVTLGTFQASPDGGLCGATPKKTTP
jgi:hypothetical protein